MRMRILVLERICKVWGLEHGPWESCTYVHVTHSDVYTYMPLRHLALLRYNNNNRYFIKLRKQKKIRKMSTVLYVPCAQRKTPGGRIFTARSCGICHAFFECQQSAYVVIGSMHGWTEHQLLKDHSSVIRSWRERIYLSPYSFPSFFWKVALQRKVSRMTLYVYTALGGRPRPSELRPLAGM